MKAIMLAAGIGRRVWPMTAECPKCLLQFGGTTLLERMLVALELAGVREVVVVVGYLRQMVMNAVSLNGARLNERCIVNHHYQKGSLSPARRLHPDCCWIRESDRQVRSWQGPSARGCCAKRREKWPGTEDMNIKNTSMRNMKRVGCTS